MGFVVGVSIKIWINLEAFDNNKFIQTWCESGILVDVFALLVGADFFFGYFLQPAEVSVLNLVLGPALEVVLQVLPILPVGVEEFN